MNPHERAQLLAAAAIDFQLSTAEADELATHLRSCEACRSAVARLRGDSVLISALPLRRPSDSVGERIVEVAQSRRPTSFRRTLAMAAIALLLAMTLVGAALTGASLLWSPDVPQALVLPSTPITAISTEFTPSPTPRPSQASPAPVRVPQRTFETSCGPVTPDAAQAAIRPELQPDSTASVLVDGLRVRSAPVVDDCSELLEPLLQGSEQVYVIAGPVVASGYDWYRVEPIGGLGEPRPGGWIARSSREGEPWIAAASPSCPTLAVTPSSLARLNRGYILACMEGRELTFEARLVPCNCDADYGPWRMTGFVTDIQPASFVQMMDPVGGATAAMPMLLIAGAAAPDPPPLQEVATVIGHYDDPTSAECAWSRSDEGVPLEDPLLTCRATFVVTQIIP